MMNLEEGVMNWEKSTGNVEFLMMFGEKVG